ncbi:hypothetical protein HD806DRAFT_501584 [Xylariaceae sp. AK1471]|nr:hypothetical protein HD806DRAFT_501584 [Xylariaceae sp. AK1471]
MQIDTLSQNSCLQPPMHNNAPFYHTIRQPTKHILTLKMERQYKLRSRAMPSSSSQVGKRSQLRGQREESSDTDDDGNRVGGSSGRLDDETDYDSSEEGTDEEEDDDGGGKEGVEGEDEDEDEDRRPRFTSGKAKKGRPGLGIRSAKYATNKKLIVDNLSRLPDTLMPVATEFVGKLNGLHKSTRDHLLLGGPGRADSDVDDLLSRILGPVFSDLWTKRMENELRVRLRDDPIKAYMAQPNNVHSTTLVLWRKCCHLRNVFPMDIIGPQYNMEYGVDVELAGGVKRPNPYWTRSFSMELETLILASPCNDNMGLLALFIRYASACRNDRRHVPMGDSKSGLPFLEIMEEEIEKADGRLSLGEIGKLARGVWESRGLMKSWDIQVLEILERSHFDLQESEEEDEEEDEYEEGEGEGEEGKEGEDEAGEGEEGGDPTPYRVITQDLKTLIMAFNNVGDLGFPMFDTDIRYKVVSQSRGRGGSPKDRKELNRLITVLMLRDMRLQEQQLRAEASRVGPVEEPEDNNGDAEDDPREELVRSDDEELRGPGGDDDDGQGPGGPVDDSLHGDQAPVDDGVRLRGLEGIDNDRSLETPVNESLWEENMDADEEMGDRARSWQYRAVRPNGLMLPSRTTAIPVEDTRSVVGDPSLVEDIRNLGRDYQPEEEGVVSTATVMRYRKVVNKK